MKIQMLSVIFALLAGQMALASQHKWPTKANPWDVTGQIGLYNTATGLGGLAAYHVLDDVVNDLDDALSVEFGLTYVYWNSGFYGNIVASGSAIEIPVMARWDIYLSDKTWVVSPRAGLTYVTSQGLGFQLGASAMYPLDERLAIRGGLSIGTYTTFAFGLNIAL